MRLVPFKQVDVFTEHALGGNPLAVVLDAEGLDGADMQRLAHWTNLSETTFVLPPTAPEASYRVRIFSPMQELPFAGHPSVGTAHAVMEAGLVQPRGGQLLQECAAGLLPVRVNNGGGAPCIAVRAPQARMIPTPQGTGHLLEAALAGLALGRFAPVLYDNGPRFWLVEAASEDDVRMHHPDLAAVAAFTTATGAAGVSVFADADCPDYQRVVRTYCPADGIAEDPVTGSANACIGALLLERGRHRVGDRYVASQGRECGRDGRVEVILGEDGVWIGGHCVTVIDGMMRFDQSGAR
jgi:PhzF family phenazine biosynthesis protein